MTATEWLTANGKEPWPNPFGLTEQWFWCDAEGDDGLASAMMLPTDLFRSMKGHRTNYNSRRYPTKEAALADFAQAYEQWLVWQQSRTTADLPDTTWD